jgi:hypothetical protein
MFPILIPSKLGTNFKGNPPKIKTLENYTHIDTKEFVKHFRHNINAKNIGLFEATELIKAFYNFDNESEKSKARVIEFVENPDYGTFKEYFRKLLKSK